MAILSILKEGLQILIFSTKNKQGIVNFVFCPVPSYPGDQPTCTAVSFAQANKIRKNLFLYF